MKRRKFLSSLAQTAAVVAAAPFVPALPALPVQGLKYHPDAFAMVMAPIRVDVLYGYSVIRPDLACRVLSVEETIITK